MNRRAFIALIGGGFIANSSRASAQIARQIYRIGWLTLGMQAIPQRFWDSLREFGWIEGRNIQAELRYAQKGDQLPVLAAELVRLKVDLIVADSGFAARAAKDATATIPIVFVMGDDPVARGLVASLARPGGNLTGFTQGLHDDKMLEMLKTAIPGLLRVAVPSGDYPSRLEGAAKVLGIEVKGIDVRSPDDIARFLAFARKAGAGAVMYPNIPRLNPLAERLAQDATRARIPAIGWNPFFARAGCLLSYGPTTADMWPRVANKVDKILRGANPADLAVELPTQFALVINLKTAKALGLSIPQSLLLRADEVIQ